VVLAGVQPAQGNGHQDLECWDAAATTGEVEALTAGVALGKLQGWQLPGPRPDQHARTAPQRRWGPLPLLVRAIAIARNAVVVLAATGRQGQPQGPWRLLVLDRATGATRQELELPGEPVVDGLGLTRSGGVLVSLCDGGVVCCGP
jgi:hypothetical protein